MVTKVFGFVISKGGDLCGRGLCVLFVWLCGVPLWLGAGYGVGAVCLMACVCLVDILMCVMCVVCGIVGLGCVCC
jgi:hypothetical protein